MPNQFLIQSYTGSLYRCGMRTLYHALFRCGWKSLQGGYDNEFGNIKQLRTDNTLWTLPHELLHPFTLKQFPLTTNMIILCHVLLPTHYFSNGLKETLLRNERLDCEVKLSERDNLVGELSIEGLSSRLMGHLLWSFSLKTRVSMRPFNLISSWNENVHKALLYIV